VPLPAAAHKLLPKLQKVVVGDDPKVRRGADDAAAGRRDAGEARLDDAELVQDLGDADEVEEEEAGVRWVGGGDGMGACGRV